MNCRQGGRVVSLAVAGILRLCVGLAILTVGECSVSANEPIPTIHEIIVSEDHPEEWPPGKWVPIPIREYRRLLENTTPSARQPKGRWIERAEYSATFDWKTNSLRSGRMTLQFCRSKSRPELFSLEPFNVTVARLYREEGDVVWGTAQTGETKVLVDPDHDTLEGDWSFPGRRVLDRTEFELRLVPAVVSQFRLRIPDRYDLESSTGYVAGPLPTDEKGWSLWRVELGKETSCRLTIAQHPAGNRREQSIFYEQNTSFLVREAELEVATNLTLDISGKPAESFVFAVSKLLAITSITSDGEFPLEWQENGSKSDKKRTILVRLPESWSGRNRTIQIRGLVSTAPRPHSVLPQILLINASFASGQMTILIESPLVLRFFRGTGTRQTQPMRNTEKGQQLLLDQYLPNASVSINVGYPKRELTAQVAAHLSLVDKKWTLTAEVDWECKASSTFSTQCQLPPEWEIADVRMQSEFLESDLVDWTVQQRAENGSVLMFEFKDALAPNAPKGVIISAKRRRAPMDLPVRLPSVVPLECDEFHSLLIVVYRNDQRPFLNAETDFEVVDDLALPDRWQRSDIWKTLRVPQEASSLILQADTPTNAGTFSLSTSLAEKSDLTKTSEKEEQTTKGQSSQESKTSRVLDPLAIAEMTSRVSLRRNGCTEHSATFQILNWNEHDAFFFELAKPASLESVRVNEQTVPLLGSGPRFVIPPLIDGTVRSVEIDYTTSLSRGFLRTHSRLIVPVVPCRLLTLQWHLAVPNNFELVLPPGKLHLRERPAVLPWTVRLFGPFGRSSDATVFNPLARNFWQQWMTSASATGRAASEGPSKTDGPQGWSIHDAFAAGLPDNCEFWIWDTSRCRAIAWIGLLACTLLGVVWKIARLPHQPRSVLCWMGCCLVVACFATPRYAEIAGGCFMGSLLALLLPRSLLSLRFPVPLRSGDPVTLAETVFMKRDSAFVLLLASLIAGHGVAQVVDNPSASRVPPGTSPTADRLSTSDVLIPRGSTKSDGVPPIAYVDMPLLHRLLQLAQNRASSSDYLISSIDYSGEVDEHLFVSLHARVRVYVLSLAPVVPVYLPFTNVNLSGPDACRVNGKACPILRAHDRSGFVVRLSNQPAKAGTIPQPAVRNNDATPQRPPAPDAPQTKASQLAVGSPRLFELELDLHPPTQPASGGGAFEMGVPAVISSAFALSFPRKMAEIRIGSGSNDHLWVSSGAAVSTRLPKTDHLHVEWKREKETPSKTDSDSIAEAVCLIDVQQSLLRYHYRVHYRAVRGGIDHVVWHIPRGIVLRKQDVVADHVIGIQTSSMAHETQLGILFAAPQTEDFTVEASWTWPVPSPGNAVTIPLINLLGQRNATITQKVGLSPPAGFRLEPRLSSKAQVIPLSESRFLESWGDFNHSVRLQAAYQVEVPARLPFAIVPQLPEQKVRMDQVIRIRKNRVDWSLHAEVETARAPAFQYAITLDPRVRAESVSVKEDDADRLSQWSKTGKNRLLLFLKNPTTDVQYVTIKGHMLFNRADVLPLPVAQFENAEHESSTVLIYHELGLNVQWAAQPAPAPIDESRSLASDGNQDVLFGRFTLSDESPLPGLRISVQRKKAHVASLVSVKEGPDGLWEYTTFFHCRGTNSSLRRLRVRIPPEIADHYQIVAPETQQHTVRLKDHSAEVTFVRSASSTDTLDISLTALVTPAKTGIWSLPQVSVVDAIESDRFLLLPPGKTRAIPGTNPAAKRSSQNELAETQLFEHWRPLVASKVSADGALPPWVRETIDRDPSDNPPSVYQRQDGWWSLERFQPAPPPQQDHIALMETQIWIDEDTHGSGQTRLLFVQQNTKELVIQLPDNVYVRTVLVDGIQADYQSPKSGILSLLVNPNRSTHTIHIAWLWTHRPSGDIADRLPVAFPRPVGVVVQRSIVLLAPPSNRFLVDHTNNLSQSVAEYLVDRLEGLLDYFKAAGKMEKSSLLQSIDANWRLIQGAARRERIDEIATDMGLRKRIAHISQTMDSLHTQDTLAEHRLGSQNRLESGVMIGALVVDPVPLGSDQLHVRRTTEKTPDILTVWTVARNPVRWGAAAIVFLLMIPLLRKMSQWDLGRWLDKNRSVSWFLVGLIWWLCGNLSAFGLGLCLVSLFRAFRRWRRPEPAIE